MPQIWDPEQGIWRSGIWVLSPVQLRRRYCNPKAEAPAEKHSHRSEMGRLLF